MLADPMQGASPLFLMHTDPVLGLTLRYPSQWNLIHTPTDVPLAPGELRPYVLTLYPPGIDPLDDNRIDIAFFLFEIASEQDLQTWSNAHITIGRPQLPDTEVVRSQVLVDPAGVLRRVLHSLRTTEIGPSQAVELTHGSLVLSISTYTHADYMTSLLDMIADSIEFAPGAPRNLNELFGRNESWPSLESVVEANRLQPAPTCDLACRDAQLEAGLPVLPSVSPDPGFAEYERRFYEWFDSHPVLRGVDAQTVQPEGDVQSSRKALPANWWSPIHLGSGTVNVNCTSDKHTGNAGFALDIGVPTNTNVYAAQAGQVMYRGWDNTGYGYRMDVHTLVNTANESRVYRHLYAHLASFIAALNDNVTRDTIIAKSGATTGPNPPPATPPVPIAPHLHFHINLHNASTDAVDASPLLGFVPMTTYPNSGATCGTIYPLNSAQSLRIIEPVAFTERYQPRSDHYWFCYQSDSLTSQRTTECFMKGMPNNGQGWNANPWDYWLSPELRYANVSFKQTGRCYIWVCGLGGTVNDDSLHMGRDDYPYDTSREITGYASASWQWQSIKMNGARPYLDVSEGERVINIWMREDGMRIDRVLLTRQVGYNPTGNIRCGGY